MEERFVGRSGLRVSRLGLGTLTWGRDTDDREAGDQLRLFLDAGGTLLDTAASYGDGASEALIGELLTGTVDREDVVISTKAGVGRPVPGGSGSRVDTSRRGMLSALDASLGRLGTDHVDLWFVQRWSESAPLEETLSALELAVASGRARYVGVSNFSGWQTALAVALAGRSSGGPLGLGVPVAAQVEYSLLQRGVEREVLPASEALGLGVLAWSPLGRGVLTGKYRFGTPSDSRAASPHFTDFVGQYLDPVSQGIVDAVCTAADGLGVEPLDVALAWVRDRPGVASALVGARTAAQLRAVLAADEVHVPAEIRRALDEISVPEASYPERF